MGCRVISGRDESNRDVEVFYCSVTEVAFGPVMEGDGVAVEFEEWLQADPRRAVERQGRTTCDPRAYSVERLMELWEEFRKVVAAA